VSLSPQDFGYIRGSTLYTQIEIISLGLSRLLNRQETMLNDSGSLKHTHAGVFYLSKHLQWLNLIHV